MLRLNLVYSLAEYIFRPINKKEFFFFFSFEIRERKYINEPKKGYSAGAWQPGKKIKNTGRPRNNNRDSRMRPRNQYIREPLERYKKKL